MSLTKLYTALKSTLSVLVHPTKTGELAFKRVDLFNNQTEKNGLQINAVAEDNLPAVFIQIKESEFMHLKNNVQRRTLRFCLHVSSLVYDDKGRVTSDGKDIEFFDLVEAVHCEINGVFVEDENTNVLFTPFVRTEEKQFIDEDGGEEGAADTEFDQVQTYIITYETVQTVINARKPKNQVNIKRVLISDVDVSNELEITGHPNVEYVIEDGSTKVYPEERVIETENTEPNIIVNPVDFPTT